MAAIVLCRGPLNLSPLVRKGNREGMGRIELLKLTRADSLTRKFSGHLMLNYWAISRTFANTDFTYFRCQYFQIHGDGVPTKWTIQ